MKKILFIALCFIYCHSLAAQSRQFYLDWAVNIARSDMKRNPDGWEKTPQWQYSQGIMCTALLKLNALTKDKSYYDYVVRFGDTMVDNNGTIVAYKATDNNLEAICGGKFLFSLYDKTLKLKYYKAIEELRAQLKTQPRTTDSGLLYKPHNGLAVWIDGSYMATPFMTEYAKRFNEAATADDAARQIILISKRLCDTKTGLYFHAWDESKSLPWADKTTGCSPVCWSRGMGWYMMAIVDMLDYLPLNHPKRAEIKRVFTNLTKALFKYQDKTTGLWYQVTDKPGADGNYTETSATAMIMYAITKATNKGYIDQSYLAGSAKTFGLFIKNAISADANGSYTIIHASATPENAAANSETYEYYTGLPQRDNDLNAIAPFILWASQLAQSAK